jgi:hypothetical protein
LRLSRDGWTGFVVLATSLVLFLLTLGLKPSALVPVGPGFYPRIILGISGLLAAVLLAQDLRGRDRPKPLPKANYRLVFVVFAIFGVYVVALPLFGYRIATLAFCAALQVALEPPAKPKDWVGVGLMALATTLVTYYLFDAYLQVLLPRGRWTDF